MSDRPANAPRVVLTMIVKDEAHVIERCIDAVRPLIDAWCIVDTGSTDETKHVISRALADLPGELYTVGWRDFAYNRSRALELSRKWGEYSLMVDADEEYQIEPGFDPTAWKRSLTADAYEVMILRSNLRYSRVQLTSTRLPFSYRGVVHEFLVMPDGATRGGLAQGFANRSHYDGARSQNPQKYLRDAEVLERALADGKDPDLASRYTFYLAQSLRDAGERPRAVEQYELRTQMGGWAEEICISWMQIGNIVSSFEAPPDRVIDAYLRAHDAVPTRAEPLCHAATVARLASRMPSAYMYASRGLEIARPETSLFMESDVYDWRLQYEMSIAAFYVGHHDEGLRACLKLLNNPHIPAAERESVNRNIEFYKR